MAKGGRNRRKHKGDFRPLKGAAKAASLGEKSASEITDQPDQPELPELARKRLLPRWAWGGCVLFVMAAALHSADLPVGGGDTWVAMACGRFQTGPWAKGHPHRTWQMKLLDNFGMHLTFHDPLGAKTRVYNPESRSLGGYMKRGWAALKNEKPSDRSLEDVGWINQNWLTHWLFYKMKSYGTDDPITQNNKGEILIVYYKFLQAILTALFAYWAGRVLGAHPLLAAGAVAFGVLLSRSYIDMRPNVSSIFFASIMLLLLSYWKQGRFWALAGMIPAMIIWSNVHGGFIYAIVIFVIALVGYALQQYAGKGSYFFLLLGLGVGVFLLIQGVGGIPQAIELVDESWQAKRIVEEMYLDLRPTLRVLQFVAAAGALGTAAIIIFVLMRFSRIDKDSFVRCGRRGIIFLLAGTSVVILIPAVFSPFGFENLLHPLIIATGEDGKLWREVVEWKPIYEDGFGKVGLYGWYLVLFTLVVVGWWLMFLLKPYTPEPRTRRRVRQKTKEDFPWPRIDLAHWGIIGITLAMSVQSRRFVFLGGVMLAPFMASMAQEIWDMFQVKREQEKKQGGRFGPLPREWAPALAGGLLSLGATCIMSYRFVNYLKAEYDPKEELEITRRELTEVAPSVFRHMVGVAAQPVQAAEMFEKLQLTGAVFNEWNQGGFVAFHQRPDPATGLPPCQLMMDGRAQAAYRVEYFQWWRQFRALVELDYLDAERICRELENERVNVALLDLEKSRKMIERLQESKKWEIVYPLLPDTPSRYYLLLRRDDPRNQTALGAVHQYRASRQDKDKE
ncbi:MAG: hypothetical protein AMJ79_05400 [Phycisphaerae bacterium SM23_30]|nr:MAG: hypothetical protein AMJ79_05400 [Phycisphaerae bacterium SM23_30]